MYEVHCDVAWYSATGQESCRDTLRRNDETSQRTIHSTSLSCATLTPWSNSIGSRKLHSYMRQKYYRPQHYTSITIKNVHVYAASLRKKLLSFLLWDGLSGNAGRALSFSFSFFSSLSLSPHFNAPKSRTDRNALLLA